MIDEKRIAKIKARAEAATPKPWKPDRPDGSYVVSDTGFNVAMTRRDYDANFIAYAREDIPYLLGEIERLQAQLTESKTAINGTYIDMGSYDRLQAKLTESQRREKAAVEDIYHMGGCPNCAHNKGRHQVTGLPLCAKHKDYPDGKCFDWRGPSEVGERE